MREILFRGKRVDNGEWVENKSIFFSNDGREMLYGYTNYRIAVEVIPETISEYTGLTDKNGKKIFEGDIVQVDGKYIRHIVYSGQHTAFCTAYFVGRQQSEILGALGDGYNNYKRQYEVIGNIHDNDELLEADND